ncbi:hypothetical protein Asppvi_001230 [Aspergillus pseudoviridinutans]|uniref:DUF7587 domain-containing protein n=1 Tax=Aspergillus pseudoviridinutans TaxID=1517512 RepID=A0A9P3EPM4_9EURO|nr:uncharacterized protein Asppvi_001230 [Aspergillus pseudoviridinutans]GIJ82719.1 hypothetical protein Asppvi_001230 [Aspergillus pseudoviridinutans]
MQLDFSIRLPRVSWNDEKRIFLCCLYKFFERDGTAFAEIFNAKYKRDLENSGFTDGRTSGGTLNSQWVDMKRHGDPIWGRVHKPPNQCDWLPIKDKILDIAQSLGVSLIEKEIDDTDTSGYRARTARSLGTSAPNSASTSASGLNSSTQYSSPLTATIVDHQKNSSSGFHTLSINKQPSSLQPLTKHGGKVCWWCLDQGDDAAEPNTSPTSPRGDYLPPLLYRWSNADSQGINTPKRYIAGLFADSDVSPFLPEDVAPEIFNSYVLNHVSIASHPSPFISTFQSVLAPIHRAMWGKEGARVSIIDTRKLTSPLYFAKALVRQNKIRIPGYSGVGEYLIWGDIQTPAIICSFKITTLIQIAQKHEDISRILQLDRIASYKRVRGKLRTVLSKKTGSMNLDHASGVSLGKLLRLINVPQEYYQMVGEGILRSWQLRKQGDWQEFCQGLEVGFTQVPQTNFSPYPVNLGATPAGRAPAKGIGTDYFVQHDSIVREEEEERFEEIEEEDDEEEDDEEEDDEEEDDEEEDDEEEDDEEEDDDEEDDEEENDDDNDDIQSVFGTPCPVRLAHSVPSITPPDTRPVHRIELYNPATGNWSLVQESQQSSPTVVESFSPESSVIALDDFEEEIEELGNLIMGEDIHDLSTPEHPPMDKFATDRERIKRLLK